MRGRAKYAIRSADMSLRRVALFAAAAIVSLQAGALAGAVRFNRDIRPILSDKCFFCHGPDAKKREADLRLDVREVALKEGAIEPGKPDESEMIERILSKKPKEHMPPAKSKLAEISPAEVETLKKWIAEGAEYEPHWAFIPLKPSDAPASTRSCSAGSRSAG
jgi:hypothetical protein